MTAGLRKQVFRLSIKTPDVFLQGIDEMPFSASVVLREEVIATSRLPSSPRQGSRAKTLHFPICGAVPSLRFRYPAHQESSMSWGLFFLILSLRTQDVQLALSSVHLLSLSQSFQSRGAILTFFFFYFFFFFLWELFGPMRSSGCSYYKPLSRAHNWNRIAPWYLQTSY